MNAPSNPTSSTTSNVSRKSASVSPGKPTIRSGRQRKIRDRRSQLLDQPQVALSRIRPPHRLEHAARPGLERQVCVLADCYALGHRLDHVAPEVLRVRACEADPLDASRQHPPHAGAPRSSSLRHARTSSRSGRAASPRGRRQQRASRSRRLPRPDGGKSPSREQPGRCSTSRPSCSPSKPAPRPENAARDVSAARRRRHVRRPCRRSHVRLPPRRLRATRRGGRSSPARRRRPPPDRGRRAAPAAPRRSSPRRRRRCPGRSRFSFAALPMCAANRVSGFSRIVHVLRTMTSACSCETASPRPSSSSSPLIRSES